MKFVFTDKKINLPNKVHAYAEKKVGKLDRYFKADTEAAMVFSVEKGRNNVELTIRSGGTIIRVAESTSDMFATIDAAVSSVERRLRRNKTRLEKRLRQDAFTRSVDAEEVSSFAPVSDEEEYRIVRTKRFPIKPMTVDEAVLQMELVGHTFFAFKDVDQDGRSAVVYKRTEGDYGLAEDATCLCPPKGPPALPAALFVSSVHATPGGCPPPAPAYSPPGSRTPVQDHSPEHGYLHDASPLPVPGAGADTGQ